MKIESISSEKRDLLANILVAIQFSILAIVGITAIPNIQNPIHSYLAFEVILILAGGIVIVSAAKALRLSLRISPIPKPDTEFVISGIYKYVRHPMYLGVILIGFGAAGFADSGLTWVLQVILIINLNVKANFEDALLNELHPESWHYRTHTSKILPCLGGSCRTGCQQK